MSQKYENFGKFILLEKLNSGGMASVYLAKSTGASGISKFIAIKRILPQYSDNKDFIEMFKAEAKIAVNLNHSNVVSIFDFGIEREQFFLAMEYVQGPNLRQVLNRLKKNRDNFSISEIVYIVKEVASGLDHAHRCLDGTTGRPLNITHRDMSPQNIMISYEGEIKIIDFGIAKAESHLESTQAGTLKGKFSYMSPEQAEGQPVDPRTDIFSLGIVLWELLANDRLFVSNNDMNTLRKVRNCQIPSLRKINPSIPAELERITNKALAKDRNLRYQTAAALHKDLNRFLNTHFPEFSPQDFSIHVKSMYSDLIEDNRKKFVEFSKVDAADAGGYIPDNSSAKGEVTQTATQTSPDGIPKKRKSQSSKASKDEMDNLLKPSDQHRVNLESLGNQVRRPNHSINTNITQSIYTQSRTVQSELRRQQTKSNNLQIALIAIALFGIAFVLWESQFRSASQESASAEPAPVVQEQNTVALFVISEPSGADIYIDGKKQDQQTSAQVLVPINKKVKVEVRKDGFAPFIRSYVPRMHEAKTLNAQLKRVQLGYIDIDVLPRVGSVIYINGKRLNQRPPITLMPIPANREIKISAQNSMTNATDQKVIKIKPDHKKKVELFVMGKGRQKPRQPSNSRKRR